MKLPHIPDELSPRKRIAEGEGALIHALNSETAFTLGKVGREVESTLAALQSLCNSDDIEARTDALYACADAVWRYFVQREMRGLANHEPIIEFYKIPKEVLNKLGAQRPTNHK